MLTSVWAILAAGLAFGLVHWLLAANGTKAWAQRLWGAARVDRYYRLAFSLVAVVTYLPLMALVRLLPDRTLYVIPFPWTLLSYGGQLVAVLFFLWALAQTDVWEFLGLRQLIRGGEPLPVDRHARMAVGGPYAWVRHPMYTAAIVFIWLSPVMTVNLAALWAANTAYLYVGSFPEEVKLVEEFGPAYRDYQRQVPRLIPRPWQRYRPGSEV
jgi:protein-S-isoprenylcysteine O-methyltransferase Ste14